jgi:alkylation response protein AidB-like acyl-CoA dehydrogenase
MQAPERQFTLFFDDVKLDASALIGELNDGLRQVFTGLNPERITAAAVANGISRYALTKASDYARERSVWGVPIGAHQGVAHPLAEAYIQVELARLATWRAADLYDSGEDPGEASNIAKFSASEAVLKALDSSIQTHGGNGLTTEFGLADLWFVARLLKTAPISREMILNFVGQHSLELPKSY